MIIPTAKITYQLPCVMEAGIETKHDDIVV